MHVFVGRCYTVDVSEGSLSRRQRRGTDCKTDTSTKSLARSASAKAQETWDNGNREILRLQEGKQCALLLLLLSVENRFISETQSHIDNAATKTRRRSFSNSTVSSFCSGLHYVTLLYWLCLLLFLLFLY